MRSWSIFAALIIIGAAIPFVSADLPPDTYQGRWEPFQGESPPTEAWYSFTPPAGTTWSITDSEYRQGSGGGNGGIFTFVTAASGDWSLIVTVDNTFGNCDDAGDGSVGATIMPRGAAAATLFQFRVLKNCGTNAITADLPIGGFTGCTISDTTFGLWKFEWDTTLDQLTVTEPDGTPCTPTGGTPAATMDGFASLRIPHGVANDANQQRFSDIVVDIDDGASFTVQATGPTPPTGVFALVTDADSGLGDSGEVELTWFLSSNDPDQDTGVFEYDIFIDGINVGTDTVTPADGDGLRFRLLLLDSTVAPSFFSIKLQAVNATSGQKSTFSCTVTIELSTLGDSDGCGAAVPGSAGSGLIFTTPTDTAAGLNGFCSDLMGDSQGSLFLCGLVLVVIVFLGIGAAFAAMAGAPGLPAVIAGSVAGFGMMIFCVIAQIWSLGAAAIIILLATGVALGLMRGLFFGRNRGSG